MPRPKSGTDFGHWHRFWEQVSFRAELKTHRLVTQNGRDSSMMVKMR